VGLCAVYFNLCIDGPRHADYGSPGSLPVLSHGELKIAQSLAIENYLASIAPKFVSLTPQQRAVDLQYCAMKEDVLAGCAKNVFGERNAEDTTKVLDKWFGLLESKVPATGFVNGLAIPTAADAAILNICTGYMPFAAAFKIANYDISAKAPKVKALADRVAAAPGVAEYLAVAVSTDANPWNK
jgi:glutathione S-transferase